MDKDSSFSINHSRNDKDIYNKKEIYGFLII